jgi:hypothetical protein
VLVAEERAMPEVTFQVLEGIDKGRVYRELPTPVTIGREEGNVLRLNDERVSRFHAKVQYDNGEVILTDLESTNGTRVNSHVIQIRRLRVGDTVGVGRSLLLFGSDAEIAARLSQSNIGTGQNDLPQGDGTLPPTIHAANYPGTFDDDADFDLNMTEKVSISNGTLFVGQRPLPPLPQKMTPSQAARLAELLDFMHRHLTSATENIKANDDGTNVNLSFADWQRVLAIQMVLARYVRAVAEPDALHD